MKEDKFILGLGTAIIASIFIFGIENIIFIIICWFVIIWFIAHMIK